MLLREAKRILRNRGFVLEGATDAIDTKKLIGRFWGLRKKGEQLSKEDAEKLLNAPDFDEVAQKYANFIKKELRSGD